MMTLNGKLGLLKVINLDAYDIRDFECLRYCPPTWIDGEGEMISVSPGRSSYSVTFYWCQGLPGKPTYPGDGTMHYEFQNYESYQILVTFKIHCQYYWGMEEKD